MGKYKITEMHGLDQLCTEVSAFLQVYQCLDISTICSVYLVPFLHLYKVNVSLLQIKPIHDDKSPWFDLLSVVVSIMDE